MKKRSTVLFVLAIASIATATLTLATIGIICAYTASFGLPESTETGRITLPDHEVEDVSGIGSESSSGEQVETTEEFINETNENDPDESETTDNTYLEIETEGESESVSDTLPSLEYLSLGNGTCAVVGIGSITDSYIVIPEKSPSGEVVTEICEKAFFNCDFIKAVEIPSTVWMIGTLAFADCDSLIYISVDEDNKAFKSDGGILYSFDMTRLISYPSANGAPTVTVPTTVKEIEPMAFNGCSKLATVYYNGSYAEWSEILIGEMNYGLYSASINCRDGEK